MRTPSWFAMALLAVGTVVVAGCAPTAAVPTPRPDNHCFVEIPVVPGETDQQGVTALWGEPDDIDYSGDPSWLYYAPAPFLRDVSLLFEEGRVEAVFVIVPDCNLGDVVGTLGPPETVEIMYDTGKWEPPLASLKWLHYPSRGESFRVRCSGTSLEVCSTFDPEEDVDDKQVYPPTTVERFRQERFFHGEYITWPGFSQ